MGKKFHSRLRVRLSETDALGVVYYGQYLTYFDVARLEMLRDAGITLGYLKKSRLGFVAAGVSCRYLASVRFDDVLDINVRISKIGDSSITYEHEVKRGKKTVALGQVIDVLVDHSGKATAISKDVRSKLSAYG